MIIEPMIVTDKIGRSIVLRNAEDKEWGCEKTQLKKRTRDSKTNP